jgi:hypothetical protein
MRALPSDLTILSPRRLHEPAHGEAVSDVPGDARQLACTISRAQGDTGERIGHASLPAAAKLALHMAPQLSWNRSASRTSGILFSRQHADKGKIPRHSDVQVNIIRPSHILVERHRRN